MKSTLVFIALMALVISVAHSKAAVAATSEFSKAVILVREGEALYREASEIVAMRPITSAKASSLASPNAKGGKFYRRERSFQDAMASTSRRVGDFHARGLLLTIGNLDAFLYSAVQSTLALCNANDGALNLKVARAILDEAVAR